VKLLWHILLAILLAMQVIVAPFGKCRVVGAKECTVAETSHRHSHADHYHGIGELLGDQEHQEETPAHEHSREPEVLQRESGVKVPSLALEWCGALGWAGIGGDSVAVVCAVHSFDERARLPAAIPLAGRTSHLRV
jgi:hypothetical protein